MFSDVPRTIKAFKQKVEIGFYNNTTFYRVENFCIQAGNCNPDLINVISEKIHHEITYHRHGQYSVGMADAGVGTATSHFFINKCENEFLNERYIVFGTVVKGMRVIWEIKKGDKIKEIILEE